MATDHLTDSETTSTTRRPSRETGQNRSFANLLWYRLIQQVSILFFSISGGVRATGRDHVPKQGGVLLLSNHLSHFDVFAVGLLLPRTLNYVARSTLFTPVLGPIIRSIGAFPIQRDGSGAQGLKETLRRLRLGNIVTFFPEGTRSRDGSLGRLKPGIAALASRSRVPIIPTGLAGTFEAWPRSRILPRPHAVRIHYGQPIPPEDLRDLEPDAVLELLTRRLEESVRIARTALERDLDAWHETT